MYTFFGWLFVANTSDRAIADDDGSMVIKFGQEKIRKWEKKRIWLNGERRRRFYMANASHEHEPTNLKTSRLRARAHFILRLHLAHCNAMKSLNIDILIMMISARARDAIVQCDMQENDWDRFAWERIEIQSELWPSVWIFKSEWIENASCAWKRIKMHNGTISETG